MDNFIFYTKIFKLFLSCCSKTTLIAGFYQETSDGPTNTTAVRGTIILCWTEKVFQLFSNTPHLLDILRELEAAMNDYESYSRRNFRSRSESPQLSHTPVIRSKAIELFPVLKNSGPTLRQQLVNYDDTTEYDNIFYNVSKESDVSIMVNL